MLADFFVNHTTGISPSINQDLVPQKYFVQLESSPSCAPQPKNPFPRLSASIHTVKSIPPKKQAAPYSEGTESQASGAKAQQRGPNRQKNLLCTISNININDLPTSTM